MMVVTVRRGKADERHAARVAWIADHVALVASAPGIHQDVTDDGRAALEVIRAAMHAAGLLGRTSDAAQRDTIRRLISDQRAHSGVA